MRFKQNEAIARKWFEMMWSTGDETVADEIIHPDFDPEWVHIQLKGPEQIKHEMRYFRGVFPDLMYTGVDLIADEDRVWVRYQGTGTHHKPAWGFEGSGQQATFQGVEILYITEEGLVIDRWGSFCMYDIFHSLGAVPPWWELNEALKKGISFVSELARVEFQNVWLSQLLGCR
jgi:predicted ester cyclase